MLWERPYKTTPAAGAGAAALVVEAALLNPAATRHNLNLPTSIKLEALFLSDTVAAARLQACRSCLCNWFLGTAPPKPVAVEGVKLNGDDGVGAAAGGLFSENRTADAGRGLDWEVAAPNCGGGEELGCASASSCSATAVVTQAPGVSRPAAAT